MSWSNEVIEAVWKKGTEVSNNDAAAWRQDQCGAWIAKAQHGNRDSQYGWEIDHIKAVENGGTDEISNLRPLQWKNNASKQAGKLTCPVTAQGTSNVEKR